MNADATFSCSGLSDSSWNITAVQQTAHSHYKTYMFIAQETQMIQFILMSLTLTKMNTTLKYSHTILYN